MRVIFAGTPEFACVALERLYANGHTIALVLTQPDRPGGRGLKLQPSAVKQFALQHGLPLAQPRSLRQDGKYPDDAAAARQAIAAAAADVMVVAAYGLILPQWVLDDLAAVHPDGRAGLGCLNIHGSLLPRWRGAAPIHRAIEAGDAETGITIMQMDAGLDTGDMLLTRRTSISPTDTTAVLHDRLADLGAELIVQALAQAGRLPRQRQPEQGVSYASKVEKHEARIDWTQDAAVICRRVRAFDPFPVAYTTFDGEAIKVWAARALAAEGALAVAAPGTLLAVAGAGITVQAGSGSAVLLTELQRAGGKRLAAAEFVRGFALQAGQCFDVGQ
ncbi:MAG: methionyl-tRNA formyltransferase [Rhodoferax sp.]